LAARVGERPKPRAGRGSAGVVDGEITAGAPRPDSTRHRCGLNPIEKARSANSARNSLNHKQRQPLRRSLNPDDHRRSVHGVARSAQFFADWLLGETMPSRRWDRSHRVGQCATAGRKESKVKKALRLSRPCHNWCEIRRRPTAHTGSISADQRPLGDTATPRYIPSCGL
jgi:hypothetical protein